MKRSTQQTIGIFVLAICALALGAYWFFAPRILDCDNPKITLSKHRRINFTSEPPFFRDYLRVDLNYCGEGPLVLGIRTNYFLLREMKPNTIRLNTTTTLHLTPEDTVRDDSIMITDDPTPFYELHITAPNNYESQYSASGITHIIVPGSASEKRPDWKIQAMP